MRGKLIGGPGHGVVLKMPVNRVHWTWQHEGRNYTYTKHPGPRDVAPDLADPSKPVLFFFDDMTASEKADAVMVETHAVGAEPMKRA